MSNQLRRVETSAAPVREKVLTSIREAIIQGWYRPGQRLIEREICELTGVSRTSVREALRQLESEGLVEMIANRGPIVARVTADDAQQLYQVRGALEGLAGRLSAESATGDQIERLVASVEQFAQAVDRGELGMMLQHKDVFYAALFDAANNAAMVKMLTGVHGRITFLRSQTLGHPGRPRETLGELRAIVDAIVARDGARAAELCTLHVEKASEIALGALEHEAV